MKCNKNLIIIVIIFIIAFYVLVSDYLDNYTHLVVKRILSKETISIAT